MIKIMKRGFSKTLNLLVNSQEKFRDSGKLNVSAAAEAMGLNQATLKRMLDGNSRQPRQDNADKICRYFKISHGQLLGNEPIPKFDGKTPEQVESEPGANFYYANFQNARIRGTMGTKQAQLVFEDDYTVYPRAYRCEWIDRMGLDPEYLQAHEVEGSSMEPHLYHGDTVLINKKSATPKHGKAFAIFIEDELCIKRLRRRDQVWWVTSDNPAHSHSDLPLEDTMIIVGEAVEKSSTHV